TFARASAYRRPWVLIGISSRWSQRRAHARDRGSRRPRASARSWRHLHAPRSGGARADLRRLLDVAGVPGRQLPLGYLAQLLLGDRAHLRPVGLAGALGDAKRLADQHGGRRGLRDEGERAVLVDGDDHRDDGTRLALRLGVERLAELHDVDPVLAQGG